MSFRVSDKTIEQLEFDKIIDLVCSLCKGEPAASLYRDKMIYHDTEKLAIVLRQVNDFVTLRNAGNDLSFNEYTSIAGDLAMLKKEGYVLDAEAVLRILRILRNYELFNSFLSNENEEAYPDFCQAGKIEDYQTNPLTVIQRVFDEKGEVKPNASPELSAIFKKIEKAGRQVDKAFNEIVQKYKSAQILSDTAESWKNGRRVLVIPAENKRKISGVIHDQSASGKTVFLEPQEIIQINNQLFSLENEKRSEIFKILKEVSEQLRGHYWLLRAVSEKVAEIDLIRAKARLAARTSCVVPKLSSFASLNLKGARHPLLLLQENKESLKTVPFDLEMKGPNRLLLISGPNAGGKSVTLKAVGLIHLMVYSGLLAPVEEDSVVGKFDTIFTDIGDQQSIDEGLSTYSSHLSNLNEVVRKAGRRSLVLLDEIGSGTDPKLGGAIAEGIVEALLKKGTHGIITTHYSSLKVYAFRHKGILNGAMLFDKKDLRPSYKLKVGKPGSSYAFEVAKKIGLDDRILDYARKKVGRKENAIEDLLINLQQGKAELDEKIHSVQEDKERLDKLIRNYEVLSKEFQVKRKKLQIRSKELEFKKAQEENVELQSLINQLQQEKNLEKAIELKKKAIEKRQNNSDSIKTLKKEVSEKGKGSFVIKKGSFVRLVDSDMHGEVIKVKKDKAEVLFGMLKMNVPMEDLMESRDQLEINRNKRINVKGVAFNANFSPKIDIRGYKLDDAEQTLEVFFDKALVNNARTLEVVHGKGSGALRKLVQKKMKEYRDISHSWHPDDEMGGDGVTLIKI